MIRKSNDLGICTRIINCKSVNELILKGTIRSNPPTICNKDDRTVCCPDEVSTVGPTIATEPLRQKRISEKSLTL